MSLSVMPRRSALRPNAHRVKINGGVDGIRTHAGAIPEPNMAYCLTRIQIKN